MGERLKSLKFGAGSVTGTEADDKSQSLKNKWRRDSTAKEDENDDLVSLCGSVATTAGGDGSLLNFALDEETIEVESNREFERKFFVMKEGSFPGKICALPHPASGERALYLLNERGEVFELLQLDNGKRSFFFGDSVVGNGSLHIFFPVHPLFMAIGHLQRKASDCFLTVSELLEDDAFPSLKELSQNVKLLDALKTVAVFTSEKDLFTKNEYMKFHYNEECLFLWLEERFRILKQSLTANCDENETTDDEQCFGILSDYLPESLARVLKERLGIKSDRPKDEKQHKKKRILADSVKGKETKCARTTPKRKFPKLTADGSKGSPSIASFFGTNKADKK